MKASSKLTYVKAMRKVVMDSVKRKFKNDPKRVDAYNKITLK